MAFVIPAAYVLPLAISGISTMGGFVMGCYYSAPHEPTDERAEKIKTIKEELASFVISQS